MKKLTFIFFGVFAILALTQCNSWAQKKSSSVSISRNSNNGGSGSMTMVNDGVSVKIEYDGKITFNDTETEVQTLSPDGYLRYKKNDKKLVVKSNSKGEIAYELYDDGEKLAFDAEGRKFLAEAIKDIISYGIDAEGRVERLYKNGGTAAVLREVGNMQSDFVKSMYMEYLLATNTLSKSELTEIAKKVGETIASDFEKSKLLRKFSGEYMKDEQIAKAYLEAVRGINSDFEKANILKNMLSDNKLSETQFENTLSVITDINSDFEKANVLKHLIDKGTFAGASFDRLIALVSNINSDFEKANVFKKIIETEIKTDDQWIALINALSKMSSDFEKSNVLVRIGKMMPKSEKVRTAYMKVAKTINSDMEYGKTMRAIE